MIFIVAMGKPNGRCLLEDLLIRNSSKKMFLIPDWAFINGRPYATNIFIIIIIIIMIIIIIIIIIHYHHYYYYDYIIIMIIMIIIAYYYKYYIIIIIKYEL